MIEVNVGKQDMAKVSQHHAPLSQLRFERRKGGGRAWIHHRRLDSLDQVGADRALEAQVLEIDQITLWRRNSFG